MINLMRFPNKMKKIIAVILFSSVFFIGCKDDQEEEDYAIGEITITGIPSRIPVFENESSLNNTYKVYLNASDSMSETDPPVAKGVRKISDAIKQANGTYTVTVNLQNPNPPDTGPWAGTARYFSVMISPDDLSEYDEEAIWVKAGTTLDKGKASCDWNGLMDFRILPGFAQKTYALYRDIVREDPEIVVKP